MSDDNKPSTVERQTTSALGSFLNTVWGKLVGLLTVVLLLLGIYVEFVSAYRLTFETKTAGNVAVNSDERQRAEAQAATANAEIARETALNALRRQKAEADEAEARACKARVDSDAANMRVDMNTGQIVREDRKVIVQPFDHCDPAHRFDLDLSDECKADLVKLTNTPYDLEALDKLKPWKDKCNNHVEQGVEPVLTRMYEAWAAAGKQTLVASILAQVKSKPAADAATSTTGSTTAIPVQPKQAETAASLAPTPPAPPQTSAPIAPPKEPVAPPPAVKPIDNYDFEGGDLGEVVRDVDWSECQNQCPRTAGCVAVSYDKWNRSCYVKGEIRLGYLNPRSVSKIFNGASWQRADTAEEIKTFGGSLLHYTAADRRWQMRGTLAECAARCSDDAECLGVVRAKQSGICDGVHVANDRTPDGRYDSAAKQQPVPE